MNISDMFFIVSFILIAAGLLGILTAALKRRWDLVKRLGLGLAIYVGVYTLLLVGVALLSPQRVMVFHQLRCFDDWCAAVESVEQRSSIGALQAKDSFYLVTIDVLSQAKRIRQRAVDASAYVIDERGNRYDPSPEGTQALEAAGQAGQPMDSWLEAGTSITSTMVFDLPADIHQPALVFTHGAFPGLIIIGDEASWLHKPTIVRLGGS
jgi:hypothetical protein